MIRPMTGAPERTSINLDHILSYIVGDASEEESLEIEERLAASDPAITELYARAVAIFTEIPNILGSATPPAFVRERVMEFVQQDSGVEAVVILDHPVHRSLFRRLLDFVQGGHAPESLRQLSGAKQAF